MKRLILIGLLLTANHVFAQSAATVLFTQNKVMFSHNGGSEHALSRGAALEPGDQVTTFDDAAAHLQYSNGALVNIGSNSTYKILAYSPQADVQINAELSNGKVEIENPGKIKETLKTPITSLAILGTHINVEVSSGKMTYIQVVEGLVLVRSEYLRPGDSVRVTSDRIVNVPFPKGGIINSPVSSPGKIEATANGATSQSGSGGAIGAQTVTFVSTSQVTGTSTTTGTQAVQQSTVPTVATISLACN